MIIPLSLLFLQGCATLGFKSPKPVTVANIIAMSRKGVSAEDIIKKMRDSGTVYRLKASQLAELKNQGIPDAVIDYMQQTYLEAVRRNQALEDWNYWWPWDGYWYGGPYFGWPDMDDLD